MVRNSERSLLEVTITGHSVIDRPLLKRHIWAILQQHKGIDNAILGRDIARQLGMRNDRLIRALISEMVSQDHLLIGSLPGGNTPGFFIIETHEELLHVRHSLRARAMSVLVRDKALRVGWLEEYGERLQPMLPGIDEWEMLDAESHSSA